MMKNRSINNKDASIMLDAILALKSKKELEAFLADLLTENELLEFANRLKAAKLLSEKVSYIKIEQMTGLSSTTIARISKWLQSGPGGYAMAISRLKKDTHHFHGA